MSDLRFALRQLLKAPGFTAVAVLTLGLGIGACAAIFSVVDRVLLRAPPFPEPERVMVLRERAVGQGQDVLATPSRYLAWRQQAASFQSLGALMRVGYNLTGTGEPLHVYAARISASALPTLQVKPALGRNFSPEEELESGREHVAILAHRLWQERFGGRPEVVGRTIQLDGRPFTVVGVMPRASALPGEVELLAPLGFSEGQRQGQGDRYLQVFGRLKPGVTVADARNELGGIAARMAVADPASRGWGSTVVPLVELTVAEVRPVLLSLMGAVGLLLLIACSNVANLLLARATSRSKEMAVRLAIGASRLRIIRQLLIESVLLAVLGAAAGVLLASFGLDALLALAPPGLPRAQEVALDGRALGFTLGLAMCTGIGFGLVPAFQATRGQLHAILQQGGRSTTETAHRRRLRGALVVGEVAIAMMLLAGAGLLMRSFAGLLAENPGFNPRDALIVTATLARQQYDTPAQWATFAEQTLADMAALPGVQAAAVATNIPYSEPVTRPFHIPGRPRIDGALPASNNYLVSPDYFRAMGIPLRRGRPFDARDGANAPRVAIISESLARRFFPGEDPLGKRIDLGRANPREIVGVVGDIKPSRLAGDLALQTYEPFAQNPVRDFTYVVRGAGGLAPGLPAALRATITRADPRQPTNGMRPLTELMGDSIARHRFAMTLFAVFSAAALLLAAVGLYGVVSYTVAQRTGEIGIRVALGAQAGDVLRLVLAQGGRLVGLGVLAGVAGALLLTRFLESLLFGISARDPLTLLFTAAVLAASAALACLLPARRAARIDPMVALRTE
jgi:putative ABC transport system permease protein